jgi:hypothetical protein
MIKKKIAPMHRVIEVFATKRFFTTKLKQTIKRLFYNRGKNID